MVKSMMKVRSIILPRALSDGNPHSHQKINRTERLQKRHTIPEITPFLSCLPRVPQAVIIYGMFAHSKNTEAKVVVPRHSSSSTTCNFQQRANKKDSRPE
jgi:hypothetical protein